MGFFRSVTIIQVDILIGTGKSVLLREIISQLKSKPEMATSVAVTASTGIAGLNIGGSTVHSFAGIGLGKETAEKLAEKIKYSERLRKRWRGTKILIIDESESGECHFRARTLTFNLCS